MLVAESKDVPPRVLLAVLGTRGDVYPTLSIGKELRCRGVHVSFAVQERFRSVVEDAGLVYKHLGPDTTEPQPPHLTDRERKEQATSEYSVRRVMYPRVEETYRDLLEAGKDADVLVHAFFLMPAHMAAQKLGIPHVPMFYSPGQLNSMYDPPILPPLSWLYPLQRRSAGLATGINRVAQMAIRSWSAPYRALREREGFGPETGDPLLQPARSPFLSLALFSSCMGEAQPDWPSPTVTTGFPFVEEQASDDLKALLAFQQAGEAPVVVSLGSSLSPYRARFFATTIELAKALGRRLVVLAADQATDLRQSVDPLRVFVTEYAPYSIAFKDACCVIVAGTVGAISHALRLGIPMLVVASESAADQPDAGIRCERMGVARWVHLRDYTAAAGRPLLEELLREPSFAEHALRCKDVIKQEGGASGASEAILGLLALKKPECAARA